MSKRLHRWCLLLVTMIMVFAAYAPVTNAQQATQYDWFGWGVNVDFQNKTWKVRYVTYLGSNTPSPHVVVKRIQDISAQCEEGGAGRLSYPSTESAYFNGNVYLQCDLPSVRDELRELNYTPPSGDAAFCPCMLGGGPFWVDGQVRQLNTLGTMPFLDASDRGVRVDLLVNNGTAQTRLEVARAQPLGGLISYTTPSWAIDAAGNQTLIGWGGKRIVAVADHFNWLDYLKDAGWRPFFKTNVTGSTIGSWNESSATTVSDTSSRAGTYRMGMNAGTLYIGYSPSSGTYFTGEIDRAGVDPGCPGL